MHEEQKKDGQVRKYAWRGTLRRLLLTEVRSALRMAIRKVLHEQRSGAAAKRSHRLRGVLGGKDHVGREHEVRNEGQQTDKVI